MTGTRTPFRFTAVIAVADAPTVNGRVYPAAVLEQAAAFFRDNPNRLLATLTDSGAMFGQPALHEAVAICESLSFTEGKLVGTFKLLPDETGDRVPYVRALLESTGIATPPVSFGKWDGNVVTEMSLRCVHVVPPDDAPHLPPATFDDDAT